MTDTKSTIAQDLEHLFKKSTEANQVFFSEGVKFVRQLGSTKARKEDLLTMPKQLFQDAMNMFVKLNIQHASNLVDLGIAISKRMNQQGGTDTSTFQQMKNAGAHHADFTITISGEAGQVVNAQFLLDSDKQEPVICNLTQSEYVLQTDPSIKKIFETSFSPQSVQLVPREPQKIDISVQIPTDATAGTYQSNILVQGFEHSYFSLILHVSPGDGSTNKISE